MGGIPSNYVLTPGQPFWRGILDSVLPLERLGTAELLGGL